jgi:hypothetical protein
MAKIDKKTILDVLPMYREYRAATKDLGGSFHIVFDDGNVTDADVRFCIEYAKKKGDESGVVLGELLLGMSKTQRKKLSRYK